MNDENAISNDACEEALPQNGSSTAQEAENDCGRGDPEHPIDTPEAQALEADPAIFPDPVQDPDFAVAPDLDADKAADVEQLRGELKRLQQELSAQKDFYRRVEKDYEEFRTLYPNTPLSELPDRVWDDVRCGIPIAAAYALAEQRMRRLSEQADGINRRNNQLSSGAVLATEPAFFSPSEVRAMSREEVRKNYSKILDSMKNWK